MAARAAEVTPAVRESLSRKSPSVVEPCLVLNCPARGVSVREDKLEVTRRDARRLTLRAPLVLFSLAAGFASDERQLILRRPKRVARASKNGI